MKLLHENQYWACILSELNILGWEFLFIEGTSFDTLLESQPHFELQFLVDDFYLQVKTTILSHNSKITFHCLHKETVQKVKIAAMNFWPLSQHTLKIGALVT